MIYDLSGERETADFFLRYIRTYILFAINNNLLRLEIFILFSEKHPNDIEEFIRLIYNSKQKTFASQSLPMFLKSSNPSKTLNSHFLTFKRSKRILYPISSKMIEPRLSSSIRIRNSPASKAQRGRPKRRLAKTVNGRVALNYPRRSAHL